MGFVCVPENPGFHRKQPDIRLPVTPGLIHEIFLICGPAKVTLITSKLSDFAETCSVWGNFEQPAITDLLLGEENPLAVW